MRVGVEVDQACCSLQVGDSWERGAAIAGLIGRRLGVTHGLVDGKGGDRGEQADNIECGNGRANNKYPLRIISLFREREKEDSEQYLKEFK